MTKIDPTEREAFEAIVAKMRVKRRDYPTETITPNGGYYSVAVNAMWKFWQIASAERASAERHVDRMEHALHQIKQWSEAYPLDVFPEPDFKKAHEVLTANGMTLDAISASNMRHVITRVQKIVDAAMNAEPTK